MYIHSYIGKRYGSENSDVGLNDSGKGDRWRGKLHSLPRDDCDKWNYWNSFMFSFTAITTIGKKIMKI